MAGLQLLAYLIATGELGEVVHHVSTESSGYIILALLLNGIGAFLLNIVSFVANKKVGSQRITSVYFYALPFYADSLLTPQTSPLAMNIGGIAKQVITIIVGIVYFGTPAGLMSVLGIAITVAGICLYSYASYTAKSVKPGTPVAV